MDANFIPESMSLKRFRLAGVTAVIMLAAVVGWRVTQRQVEQQWFAIQRQQLALINRLADFPHPTHDAGAWREEIVTLHNVWGNVTYSPSDTQLTVPEMLLLQQELERILAATSSETSRLSVELVFELLLARGQKLDFINGYLEDFRSRHLQHAETGRLFRLLLAQPLRC